jgi:hypothetical protein
LTLQLRDEPIQGAQLSLQRANGASPAANTRRMTAALTFCENSMVLAQPLNQLNALFAQHSTEVGGLPDRLQAVSILTGDCFCLKRHERHSSHTRRRARCKPREVLINPEESYSKRAALGVIRMS